VLGRHFFFLPCLRIYRFVIIYSMFVVVLCLFYALLCCSAAVATVYDDSNRLLYTFPIILSIL
jgi:hypothetical protein